jgi:CBS domain-containing protein
MMSTGIHHLAVERQGRIVGVITSHDIMHLQGSSPYTLLKEIVRQKTIADLYPLSRKIPGMIRGLIKEGARASNISRMISILNDHILDRLLTLLQQEMGPPPLPYCWLLLGSEGRREQTFKTDQDNAILYADPGDEDQARVAHAYFSAFAECAIKHLVACGYPLCPGEIMAKNPRWCQPASVWKGYFDAWIKTPEPREILHSTIFFDFRAGYGDASLAENLRNHLNAQLGRGDIFLLHLARECMGCRAPLSFFRNFIVEKDGEHKDKLDVKKQGILPFVSFARVLALKHGIKETNTIARFQVLASEEHVREDLYRSSVNAYELQMQHRLIHQLHQIEAGEEPDNHIDPAHLSDLEKRTLKDAFTVIERLQSVLRTMFPSM